MSRYQTHIFSSTGDPVRIERHDLGGAGIADCGLLIADSMQVTWAANGKSALVFIAMPVAILAGGGIAWLQRSRTPRVPDAAGE